MPPTQRKNIPQKPPVKSRGYEPEDHEGKLYRVRDKDYGDGQCQIWGENLPYEVAQKLHQKVTGSRKSRTARIEEMSIPLPSADPAVEGARQAGLAAGRTAAASANARHQQMMAQRKVAEMQAASAPKPKNTLSPTLGGKVAGRHHAPVPVKPQPPKQELDPGLEAPDVEDEAEVDEVDEVGAVSAAAEDDINEYEAKGKELYEAWVSLKTNGHMKGYKTWDQLAPKDQAAWSFEAAAEQGKHVDELKAAIASGQVQTALDAGLVEGVESVPTEQISGEVTRPASTPATGDATTS